MQKTSMQLPHQRLTPRPTQRGATLIELMVGITIGLLTVTVGMGALMVSRSVSGTVTEASEMQQQASYAFRVIGQQLKQAGGMQMDVGNSSIADIKFLPLPPDAGTFIKGKDAPGATDYKLEVRYQNIEEDIYPTPPASAAEKGYLMRDCLGQNAGITSSPLIVSKFVLDSAKKELQCQGATGSKQAMIRGVNGFTVNYVVQIDASTSPTYQYTSASTANFKNIYAVQVCLELEGTENINTAGATYTNCQGTSTDRGNKMRMVFRNTYYLRNHVWS